MTKFIDAFARLQPIIEMDFIAYVERTVARYADIWVTPEVARDCMLGRDATWNYVSRWALLEPLKRRPVGEVKRSELELAAAIYATSQIEAFAAKLEQKLGDIGEFSATFARNADFKIVGSRNGHKVVVKQQKVLKFSPRGLPFHQFPARMYVDGKFTPAADYERAVA